jgi:hypothetical protein
MIPQRNIGKEKIWYSRGWKAYDPNNFIIYDKKNNNTPVNSLIDSCLSFEKSGMVIAANILERIL